MPTTNSHNLTVTNELTKYRDTLTRSMEEAAKGAGVRLLPGDIAHSIRGDLAISIAFVAPEHGIPLERSEKLFFLYVAIPERYQIAKKMQPATISSNGSQGQTIPG